MIRGIIKPGTYQDSVNLMLLSSKLSKMDGVNAVSVMMGTPANKEIFRSGNLWADEFNAAGPNDMCIAVDTDDEAMVAKVVEEVDQFLSAKSASAAGAGYPTVRTWAAALEKLPDANLALVSLPGQYAADEVRRALDKGLSVFLFSDNVSVDDEVDVKKKAHEKGLIVMGPDCGTASIAGVPLSFTNVVRKGNIGLIAASGTGLQEVMVGIDRLGSGVTQAFGLGGRDLSEAVGGITALDAIQALAADDETRVVVFISKPPASSVRDKVLEALKKMGKPVVAIFMGQSAGLPQGMVRFANTLDEAARLAVEYDNHLAEPSIDTVFTQLPAMKKAGQHAIKGLYSGGTLAAEAAMLIRSELGYSDDTPHVEGRLLSVDGHSVIDLGDDMYTVGRPHPMIDSRTRVDMIAQTADDPKAAVILLDVVLGYGSSDDMAGSLAPAIAAAREKAKKAGRDLLFVASVCGTAEDPQGFDKQQDILRQAGVYVADNNAAAVNTAVEAARYLADRPVRREPVPTGIRKLMDGLKVINMGLSSFAQPVLDHGGKVVQYDWAPVAGGNKKLAALLSKLQ